MFSTIEHMEAEFGEEPLSDRDNAALGIAESM